MAVYFTCYVSASTSNTDGGTTKVSATCGAWIGEAWHTDPGPYGSIKIGSNNAVSAGFTYSDYQGNTDIVSTSENYSRTHSSYTVDISAFAYQGDGVEIGSEGSNSASTVVTIPARTSYKISYNANGGTGAPSYQTKWYNESLTLSSTKPTKSNTVANGYTVSFNGKGASNPSSITAQDTTTYTFYVWNTSSSGKGTSYVSGGSYTNNSAATLYAIYNSTTTKGSISLPSITRSGYTFLGWYEGDTYRGVGGSTYTPTSNITLTARWQANLGNGYTLVTNSNTTWQQLVSNQTSSSSILYEVGGKDNAWSWDNNNYITLFGNKIKLNSSYVKKTDKPLFNGNYKYYT